MRIIRGKYGGRKIIPPKNLPVRPTTDFAKEALFNILENHFNWSEMRALDLFAGTGNITYELASRGAAEIIAVDENRRCCEFIKKTAKQLSIENVIVIKADVFRYLKNCNDKFAVIFADPPYAMEKIEQLPELVFEQELLKEDGWLIVEHFRKVDLSGIPGFYEKRKYGNVNFSIFKSQKADKS